MKERVNLCVKIVSQTMVQKIGTNIYENGDNNSIRINVDCCRNDKMLR